MTARFDNQPTGARRRGQATVEFALTGLILFLVLFGILEVARLVFTASDVNNGAREGAYYAALHPDTTVDDLTQQIAPRLMFIGASEIWVTLDCPTCSGPSACRPPACHTAIYEPLTVTVGYTLSTGVSFPGFAGGIPITSQTTARRER